MAADLDSRPTGRPARCAFGHRHLDDPAELAGLPDAGVGVDRRRPPATGRSRRRFVGPPAGRVGRQAGFDRPAVLADTPTAVPDRRRRLRPRRPPSIRRRRTLRCRRRRRHHLSVRRRRRRHGRVAHPVERGRVRQLARSSRRPASTSTTAASASPSSPGTRPNTVRDAGRRTRCRPPSSRADGRLRAVLGTQGGDGQPQSCAGAGPAAAHGESPAPTVGAPVGARGGRPGFDTWTVAAGHIVP